MLFQWTDWPSKRSLEGRTYYGEFDHHQSLILAKNVFGACLVCTLRWTNSRTPKIVLICFNQRSESNLKSDKIKRFEHSVHIAAINRIRRSNIWTEQSARCILFFKMIFLNIRGVSNSPDSKHTARISLLQTLTLLRKDHFAKITVSI